MASVPCDACGGEGYVGGLVVGDECVDETCWTCQGRGRVALVPCEAPWGCEEVVAESEPDRLCGRCAGWQRFQEDLQDDARRMELAKGRRR